MQIFPIGRVAEPQRPFHPAYIQPQRLAVHAVDAGVVRVNGNSLILPVHQNASPDGPVVILPTCAIEHKVLLHPQRGVPCPFPYIPSARRLGRNLHHELRWLVVVFYHVAVAVVYQLRVHAKGYHQVWVEQPIA